MNGNDSASATLKKAFRRINGITMYGADLLWIFLGTLNFTRYGIGAYLLLPILMFFANVMLYVWLGFSKTPVTISALIIGFINLWLSCAMW